MLGSTPRSPLFEALWICHQEFKQVEKQSFTKRIFLFTDSDSVGSAQDQTMALQRAKDLESLNVDIELFPLPNFTQMRPMFDIKKFYASIITFDEDEVANGMPDIEGAQTRLFELMKRIRQKEYRKRTQGKCDFQISNGTSIGLNFFTTVMPAKKPTAVKVNAANNQLLKATSKLVCQDTGHSLYQNQIGTFFPLGGEKIKLDHTEVKKIKNFVPVGMKLMGFKPKSYLKVYHNVKHSYFMHPNEKKTKGASQCSDALIKEMISQDKIAIVKFIPRENSTVRFCAMVAQEEKIDP
jgi:ATP-dependent DNA helicase 2 subunit 1